MMPWRTIQKDKQYRLGDPDDPTEYPEYLCDTCGEFATNNSEEVEWTEDDLSWICPNCGGTNYV